MSELVLRDGSLRGRHVSVCEPCGEDELVQATGPLAATRLLERLLCDARGEPVRELIWHVSLTDRDRLLACLYQDLFGDLVELRSRCAACQRNFESRFSLRELSAAQLTREQELAVDADGNYRTSDGVSFRLPTAADERELMGQSPEEFARGLLERCRCDVDTPLELVDAALELHAPVLDLELAARCAECGVVAQIHFDLAAFLLRRLTQERRIVLREVHCLARSYGWQLSEILRLRRSDRRELVQLVMASAGALS